MFACPTQHTPGQSTADTVTGSRRRAADGRSMLALLAKRRLRLCGRGAARAHLRVGGRAGGGGQRELQLAQLLARAQQQPQQRRRAQLLRACAPGAGSRRAQPALACSDARRDILLHWGASSSVRSQAGQPPRPAC
jgi:hypothetical protein